MTKEDYEDKYGERVIYCRVHHVTGIDGCIACEQEEQDDADMILKNDGDDVMSIYNDVFNKMNIEREKWETIRTSKYRKKT